jgi:hypothetical protein
MQHEFRNRDMRNRDLIAAIESRSDPDQRIIGHVASDRNFADLGSTEHSVKIHQMRNRESTLCIRLWSQPLVTRREGVYPDKLHFGVSEITTWRVEMPHLQIHETRIREKHFKHKRLVMGMVI